MTDNARREKLKFQAEQTIRLAGWHEQTGVSDQWPKTSSEVSALLAEGGGFDVDRARLADLMNRGILAKPKGRKAGEVVWAAVEVLDVVNVLSRRQQFSDKNDVRRIAWEPCVAIPEGLDVRGLLMFMANLDGFDERQAVAQTIIEKLATDGIKI